MIQTKSKPSILLVDDEEQFLGDFYEALKKLLPEEEVDIKTWTPSQEKSTPAEKFASIVNDKTVLVITDYDLTKTLKGLYGLSIVGWCQARALPVGEFSRRNVADLPEQPNLFELRVPITDQEKAAAFVASAFRGFLTIKNKLFKRLQLLEEKKSLAAVLSLILGREHLESQLALFMVRLGATNLGLSRRLKILGENDEIAMHEKVQLLSYVLGHVLLNSILKFPGPILFSKALTAYLATSDEEFKNVATLFESASYTGPFCESDKFYWREDVDKILEEMGDGIDDDEFETIAIYNRRVVEKAIGRQLKKHDCDRCRGEEGGFLCPFTMRTVCQRPDCSVAASSWIPQGADLSRVERDFYDEWAPIIGL